jgi:hypothetical protein
MKILLIVFIILCIMYIYYRLKSIETYDKKCNENWSDWGKCSKECNGGIQTRERDMEVQLINGHFCPHLVEKRPCNIQPCN